MKTRDLALAPFIAVVVLLALSTSVTQAPTAPSAVIGSLQPPATIVTAPALPPSGWLPTADPERRMTNFAAATPFAAIEIASLPRREQAIPAASLPTAEPTPASDRESCDPSYPDDRTCIPPGPPFGQGCAVTPERRFTVLPPDPQGLDHDKDGIGCEPIGGG